MSKAKTAALLVMGLLLSGSGGCGMMPSAETEREADAVEAIAPPAPEAPASPAATPAASPPPSPTATATNYEQGLEQATQATNLGQVAQSRDDWRLAASQWQQAIEFMQTVPETSANYASAQAKIPEYQRNLAVAQRQADRPIVTSSPSRSQAIATQPVPAPAPTAPAPAPVTQATQPTPDPAPTPTVFRAPIIRRVGGTPVVNVRFNGGRVFPMIVDTGASGTVITRPMAAALRVVPVGEARVNTASATNVAFPLGYVDSIEVAGTTIDDVLVAIAGPELSIGLLGQDFFQNFDVTIREREIEFRPR